MANLRDRLKRIQEQKKNEPAQVCENKEQKAMFESQNVSVLLDKGWEFCGFKVLKRNINVPSPFKMIKRLPSVLRILVPDLARHELPVMEDFLFFDLETTGLSTGAGTVAFLAAFGKIISGGKFLVTQYMLLDYPGENYFLENVLAEFNKEKVVIVSYNGKCFDIPILKTRCLMNRIYFPSSFAKTRKHKTENSDNLSFNCLHADLLHPARRLWKNIIYDCSQASVETRILGLDRTGDIPGSLAPEIWFDFLKTGNTERLTGICDHNKADITGLAAILAAIISIAADPRNTKQYIFDIERLALYWRRFLRLTDNSLQDGELQKTGEEVLRHAAKNRHPRAVYVYGYDQMRKGNYNTALEFVNMGLELYEKDTEWYQRLIRRKERLEKKINQHC